MGSEFVARGEFVVSKEVRGVDTRVNLLFPHAEVPEHGVTVRFQSKEDALAVAYAILAVAEGGISEMRAHLVS